MKTLHHPATPERDPAVLSSDELAEISGGVALSAIALLGGGDGWCGTPWPQRFPIPPRPPIDPWKVRLPVTRF
ncbi:MAG: hypothetical protein ACK522_11715 [Synechococcaceae cyanobacterium]|jgi:hypothetical protein